MVGRGEDESEGRRRMRGGMEAEREEDGWSQGRKGGAEGKERGERMME